MTGIVQITIAQKLKELRMSSKLTCSLDQQVHNGKHEQMPILELLQQLVLHKLQ
jgi:hypothetical protein